MRKPESRASNFKLRHYPSDMDLSPAATGRSRGRRQGRGLSAAALRGARLEDRAGGQLSIRVPNHHGPVTQSGHSDPSSLRSPAGGGCSDGYGSACRARKLLNLGIELLC